MQNKVAQISTELDNFASPEAQAASQNDATFRSNPGNGQLGSEDSTIFRLTRSRRRAQGVEAPLRGSESLACC